MKGYEKSYDETVMNISISLTPELVSMIKAKVAAGRYRPGCWLNVPI